MLVAAAEAVDLFEAYSEWWGGTLTGDKTLFGLEIVWWGRIGLGVAYVAALTIVIEIVGEERLKATGDALTKRYGRPLDRLRRPWAWSRATLTSMATTDVRKGASASAEARKYGLNALVQLMAFVVFLGVGSATTYLLVTSRSFTVGLLIGGVSLGVFAGSGAAIGLIVIVAAIRLALGVVGSALAWFLSAAGRRLAEPKFAQRAKIASAVLLMVGFHFDMLAS